MENEDITFFEALERVAATFEKYAFRVKSHEKKLETEIQCESITLLYT